jgi:hypothetical protein
LGGTEALENLLSGYLDFVADYKFSAIYNKWAFLAAVSACLERKCWLDENALGFLYPNLYVVFVGPPASRKTTTAKVPVYQFLKKMENGPILCSNQLTPASLIDELKDAGAIRYEHKTSPLFVLAGEFGVWFKDIGGGSMFDLLLEFYDSRMPGEIWQKNTKKWGKQEMPNPALTLLGCTTPKEIIQSRVMETAGIGFTSRVIFVCEPRFIPGCAKFPPLNGVLAKRILAEFYRINAIAGPFALGEGTEAAIEGVMNRTNAWMEENPGTTIMANYMARKPVQVRKVAMLLSAMRDSRRIIRVEDIQMAEALMLETEPTLPTAFGLQIHYNDPGLSSKILDKLQVKPLTEKQILSAFFMDGQSVPSEEFDSSIKFMVKSGGVIIKKLENGEVTYAKKS